ncbi:hypothetical protein [Leisingera sp. ANG-Vp]|uniref:hypothetical protein n=1 Tax=Leisingera sp. ANG-Vp TaxID=1577896 RepID=UPI00057E8C3A|nr:hypothetical protein [Leisingera sp. ANG-Vp]KIC22626.1 hypothetical protein RA20_01805 [Leisingera sp. ANG-Vp]
MPIILGALAVLAAAYFWFMRARNAAAAANDILDAAKDVRLAARRFGFRRRSDVHPAEGIEDDRVALAGLAASLLELQDYPTAEQKEALVRGLRDQFSIPHSEAEELAVLGRWIMQQCGSPDQAVTRLTRRLYKLSQQTRFAALAEILKGIAKFGDGSLSDKQKAALGEIARGLRIH